MIDFVFFHEKPFALFVKFLFENKIETHSKVDDDSYEISISEDLTDDMLELIETEYDRLFEMNQQLMESEASSGSAGVLVNLKNGRTCYADIPHELLGKIMSVLTPEEMGDVVNAIVDAVEQPDYRTLCEKARDQ